MVSDAATSPEHVGVEQSAAGSGSSPSFGPAQVPARHAEAFASGDLDRILEDYTDDSLLITAHGANRGRAQIRSAFIEILAQLQGARFERTAFVVDGDTLLLCWSARTDRGPLGSGNETFVFDGPLIQIHSGHLDIGVSRT